MARWLTGLLVAGGIAGLSACGGQSGSGDARSEDADQVRDVVERTLTESDPGQCAEDLTEDALEQLYFDRGTEGVEQCRSNSVEGAALVAESVEFGEVRVEGDEATATVAVTGGSYDGALVGWELEQDDGRWKIDRLAEIDIDRARFDAATIEGATALGFSESEGKCSVERIQREFSTPELERYLTQREGDDRLSTISVQCLSTASLRRELEEQLRTDFEEEEPGLSESVVDCIIDYLQELTPVNDLRAAFTNPEGQAAMRYQARIEVAARLCAEGNEPSQQV